MAVGVYETWQELLEDEGINAVCIGTWPYMHRAMTLAALEKGKHVLTEARMAMDSKEAHDMLDASRRYPHLVTMLTPTSTAYRIDNLVQQMIGEGYLGELLSVEVQALQTGFADTLGNLVYKGTSRNFNASMAPAATVTVVEVDEIIEPGGLNPEEIVTPGIFVQRIVQRPVDFSPYD